MSFVLAGLAIQSSHRRIATEPIRGLFGITVIAQRPCHFLQFLIEADDRFAVDA
jgi:hypothetical protein